MPHLLVVNASPRTDSLSRQLSYAVVNAYREVRQDATVDRLDTFADLPVFGQRHVDAKMAVIAKRPVPEAVTDAWNEVLAVAARLRRADIVVFAVPMWNGGLPWSLKLFVDIVTQPGIAFSFDPAAGYRGLLGGRRAVVVYTSRVYAPGCDPAFGADHQSTYLDWWLRYCGITEVDELRLQPTLPGDELESRRTAAAVRARELGRSLARVTQTGAR
jgi:FMN-dependent NADH-azoreductase